MGTTGDEVRLQLEELGRRVAALEDEREILRTLYRYAHAIDYGDEAAWVDCFTDDGAYILRSNIPGRETLVREFVGREAIRGFFAQHTHAPAVFHKHMLVEPIITIDGDRATVASYFQRLDVGDGVRAIKAFGRYLDDLVREADGRWRIERRVGEIESSDREAPT